MRKAWFFVFLHMLKKVGFLFCLLLMFVAKPQDITAPVDLRQHNLTQYNSSFFNPVLSFYGNNPQSIALWARWQWQQVDSDPTTVFLNYTQQLNQESTAAVGFFQHNTGLYKNTGALLNYAYIYTVNDELQIGLGINFFGYKQAFTDTQISGDPNFPLPQTRTSNDFIIQAAPGLLLKWNNLQLGLTSENLFDYNFARKERHSDPRERIYLVSGGYDFHLFSGKSVLRPVLYWKIVPFYENQLGISTLFSADKYWVQAGYNDFYGASVGAGGRFFKKVSIGAMMEFATNDALDGKNTTFEIIAAFSLGKQESKEKKKSPKTEELIVQTEDDDAKKDSERKEVVVNLKNAKAEERKRQKEQRQKEKETSQEVKNDEKIAQRDRKREAKLEAGQREKADDDKKVQEIKEVKNQQRADSILKVEKVRLQVKEQQKMDSLASLATERMRREEAAMTAQKRLDSISDLQNTKTTPTNEEVALEKNEKYEEVKTEDGLRPGFYLIANVFGTKTYFKAFMESLDKKGLQPKSFLRSLNNYNYVYLERYDTMEQARKSRNSNFFGKYTEKTWIFRVVGE